MSVKKSNRNDFKKTIDRCVEVFPNNKVCRAADSNEFQLRHYHKLLKTIFHQTYEIPSMMALAGALVDNSQTLARNYLIEHSFEEIKHWEWTINDLKNTGYTGVDPREEFPPTVAAAYISFNYYCSSRMPLTRLATALMLETIGATYSKKYAMKVCENLKLRPDQATFFFGHGDTDVKHTAEIWETLDKLNLSDEQWGQMVFAAETALDLYIKMYDQVMEE